MQCKCRVVQILSSSGMCDKFGQKTKELPGLIQITDHISYIIHEHVILLQGKSGMNWGGLLPLANLTDACCKVHRTLKSSSNFDRTPNGTYQIR